MAISPIHVEELLGLTKNNDVLFDFCGKITCCLIFVLIVYVWPRRLQLHLCRQKSVLSDGVIWRCMAGHIHIKSYFFLGVGSGEGACPSPGYFNVVLYHFQSL